MARQVYIPGHFFSIGLVIQEEGEEEYLVQGITFSESQPAGPGPSPSSAGFPFVIYYRGAACV